MSGVELKVGVSDCDRMRPLVDGTVKIEGGSASFHLMPVQELFNRQLSDHIFDCCEFPLATFLRTLERIQSVPMSRSRYSRRGISGCHVFSSIAMQELALPLILRAAELGFRFSIWLRPSGYAAYFRNIIILTGWRRSM